MKVPDLIQRLEVPELRIVPPPLDEETKQASPSYLEPQAQKLGKKSKSKRKKQIKEKYKKRKDVVLKGILRKFRKFIQDRFLLFSDGKGFVQKEVDLEWLRRFSRHILPNDYFSHNIDHIIASLIFPIEMEKGLEDQLLPPNSSPEMKSQFYQQIKNLLTIIHNVLYKYSHQKLEDFCRVSELAYIFTIFYDEGADLEKSDEKYADSLEFI